MEKISHCQFQNRIAQSLTKAAQYLQTHTYILPVTFLVCFRHFNRREEVIKWTKLAMLQLYHVNKKATFIR